MSQTYICSLLSVVYPGNLFGGGVKKFSSGQIERGSGGSSPLVRGSGGSCNLVQEISFHIVTTTCFSCSPPDLNLVVTNFMFCLHVKYPLLPGDNQTAVNK